MTSNNVPGTWNAHAHAGVDVRDRTHDSMALVVKTPPAFHSELEDTEIPSSNRKQMAGENPERRFG